MSLRDRYAALPSRLQQAVKIWLGISLVCALLPSAASSSVGVLAQPMFWIGLPMLALLPYRQTLFAGKRIAGARRGGKARSATLMTVARHSVA